MHSKAKLDVVICGAGIAGLAAAAALALDHNVTVYDRRLDLAEASFAINLKPNAAHAAFGAVGLDRDRLAGTPCLNIVEREAATGEIKLHKSVDAPREFGGPWYFCQRVALHNELQRVCRERGVVAKLGCEVQSIDGGRDGAQVGIKDDQDVTADLVLVADGMSSRLRGHVLQDDRDYVWDSGQVAYRAFIPADRLRGRARLDWLTQPDGGGLYIWSAQKQRLVAYPCPDHVNIVAIVDKDGLLAGSDARGRSATQTADDMRAQFATFEPLARELLAAAPTASLWPLCDVSPLPRYHAGTALLIGDAAHATLPHQGQGASLAFEDAEALSHLLHPKRCRDVAAALSTFTQLRTARVHAVQRYSRIMAQPASYDKGETVDALRFAASTLTYRGLAAGAQSNLLDSAAAGQS